MNIEKKYQVFVSSTYEDLQIERQEVMHALLELDSIPAGMELFPAANEDQWSLIKGVIDDCDYYIVIIGGRYGSIGSQGISYTEMEYRYALESGKPIIAFLHKQPDSLPKNKTEKTPEGQEKYDKFREFAQQKMCKFWTDAKDLGSVVSRSLIMLQKTHPGVGWIRGDLVPSKESAMEILDLKKEIDKLQKDLNNLRHAAPEGSENLAQGEDLVLINCSFSSRESNLRNKTTWTSQFNSNWNEIFYTVSPLMIDEASDYGLRSSLNSFVKNKTASDLRKDKRFKELELLDFTISNEDFQTIKVQLRALGLITKSNKNRSVKDTHTYWTLTPYGDEVMTRLRAIKK
ncbi:MAG TPA: DUF4062 domain-containing protein [Bacteroidales bacterium]